MVKHTHQDFLAAYDGEKSENIDPIALSADELAKVRPLTDPKDLFDFPGPYCRKVNLSELDEFIDDPDDWRHFTRQLCGLNQLIMVDDRPIVNPLMTTYDRTVKLRYAKALAAIGCPCVFVKARMSPTPQHHSRLARTEDSRLVTD